MRPEKAHPTGALSHIHAVPHPDGPVGLRTPPGWWARRAGMEDLRWGRGGSWATGRASPLPHRRSNADRGVTRSEDLGTARGGVGR